MIEEIGPVGAAEGAEDLGPVSLSITGGQVVALPSRVRRLPADALAVVADVQGLVADRVQIESDIDRQVEELRGMGVSWSVIAWSLGMSEAGAKRRYGVA